LRGAFLLAHHPKLPGLISTMLVAMQKPFGNVERHPPGSFIRIVARKD
jgi:hypothetical protein